MTIYQRAPQEVTQLLSNVIREHHPDLVDVDIDTLFAGPGLDSHGEPKRDWRLMHNGYPAAAIIKKTSLKDRAKGVGDAELVISEPVWKQLDNDRRLALLDHEMCHLHHTGDTDDLHRPKLAMCNHDHQIGVFREVLERHGQASLDYQMTKRLVADAVQLSLDLGVIEPA